MKGLRLPYAAALALALFSCKTASVDSVSGTDPLALLDSDSSIYMSIPVQKHKELVSRILVAEIPSLSEKDASSLAARLGRLYAGLGTARDRSRLQVASSCDIPRIAVSSVMKKKNGWNPQSYKANNSSSYEYYSRLDEDFQAAFPSTEILCAAKNVAPMLEKHSVSAQAESSPANEWISAESDDILFYITRPGQYLRSLIGAAVTVGVESVSGSLKYAPGNNSKEYSGKYDLTFRLTISDKRTMPALRSMLALSFAMVGGTVSQIDDSTLELGGVEVTARQIEELLTRDPITGKHYRVVGDKVIQENVR